MKQKKITFHSKNISKSKILKEPYGMKLWKRAKKIIPGGNMLLSKDLKFFYLIDGPLIIKEQKVAKYGMLVGKNLLICH